ncbi:MAG TPA: LamG domain-containing protein [Polyangiaceae bacterium]
MRCRVALSLGLLAGCSLPVGGLGAAGDTGLDGGGLLSPDASDDVASVPGDADPADGSSSGGGDGSGAEAGAEAGPDAEAPPDAPASSAGDALRFSAGAYVDVGQLPIPGDFTLEAWVMPTSVPAETCIAAEDRNNQAAGQFRLGLVPPSQLFFIMSDATGNTGGLFNGTGFALRSTQPVPLGAWTHVAVTKKAQTFTLYANAAQVAQFQTTGGPPLTYGGPAVAFRIAARVAMDGTSVDEAFTGTIDEVRLWNVSRTAGEIAASMSKTIAPSTPGLLAYWRFDDGAGTTASDEGNHYPGALVAQPVWVVSTAF